MSSVSVMRNNISGRPSSSVGGGGTVPSKNRTASYPRNPTAPPVNGATAAARRLRGTVAREQPLQFLERVTLRLELPAGAVLLRDGDGLAAALEDRGGPVAQE